MEKKKKGKKIAAVAVYLLMCAVLGWLIGAYFAFREAFDGDMLPFILQIYLGLFLGVVIQIPIHEAGHLIFGLMSGYGFSSYRIVSFMWIRENGKVRFRRYSLAGTGGQCLMIPPEPVNGQFPTVLYNLGGCILNLVSSVVFFIVAFLPEVNSFLGLMCFISGLIGVILALTNGIPMNGTVANDGYNALSLRKDPLAMGAMWLQLKINEQVSRGVRLKDMPEDWFTVPADEEMKNPLTATVGVFCCNRLMDQHRFEEADALMERIMGIDEVLPVHRNLLTCDRITCCLLLGKNDGILSRWEEKDFRKVRKTSRSGISFQRTEYIWALLRARDPQGVEKAAANFEKIAKRYPYPGEVESERELMKLAWCKGESEC